MMLLSLIVSGVLAIAQSQRPADHIASIESLIRSQKYNQALADTQACLWTNAGDPRLWTLEGVIYSLMGDSHKGISTFEKADPFSELFPCSQRGNSIALSQA